MKMRIFQITGSVFCMFNQQLIFSGFFNRFTMKVSILLLGYNPLYDCLLGLKIIADIVCYKLFGAIGK